MSKIKSKKSRARVVHLTDYSVSPPGWRKAEPSVGARGCWKLDDKPGPFAQFAFAPDLTVHRFDHLLHDGQTQTSRVFTTSRLGAQTRKFAKEHLLIFDAQARAFILRLAAYSFRRAAQIARKYASPWGRVFHSVGNQVLDDLREHGRIGQHRNGPGFVLQWRVCCLATARGR